MRAGFIGLGSQGGPMALRIAQAGVPLTVWARRPEACDPYRELGASVADSPAALGAECDVVGVCVVDEAGVRQVLEGPQGVLAGLRPGGVVAVHATISPAACRDLAEIAARGGVALVDAPVSGGQPAAEAGRLLVMVGGEADAVERCRPVFATYGDPVVHLGGLGSGQVAKILNNVLFTANLATATGALALGEALGVDPSRLAEVMGRGSGQSFALARVHDGGGTLERMGLHAGPLLRKDVGLMADLVAAAGGPAAAEDLVIRVADAALERMHHPR